MLTCDNHQSNSNLTIKNEKKKNKMILKVQQKGKKLGLE